MSVFFSAHYHRGIEQPKVSVYLGDFGPSLKLSTVSADVTICGDDVAHLRGILAEALDALDLAEIAKDLETETIKDDPFMPSKVDSLDFVNDPL